MQSVLSTNRRRWVLFAAVLLGAILLSWTPPSIVSSKTQAKMPQTRTPKIENYDIRDEESDRRAVMAKHGLQSATAQENRSQLVDTMRVAQTRLKKQKSNLDVEWNKKIGAPEIVGVLSAQEKLTGRSNSKRSDIVRQFIADNHDLYGLTLNDVTQLKTTTDYANPNGNMSWVELEQQINGIPVFQGSLRAGLTKDGELIRTTGLLVPGLSQAGTKRTGNQLSINSSTSSGTNAAEAVAAAARSIGVEVNPAELVLREASEDGNSYIFEPGPFAEEIKVRLEYFPLDSGAVTLAWSMILWQDIPAYYLLVDAQGGDLLWRMNITSEQTQSATYSIYNGDSPAPLSPFVGLPGSNIQGAGIPRTTFTNVSELPAFDNLGWITDGGNTTTGNNVDAGLDLVSPNGIDPGGRPIGSPARVFDFPYNPPPLGVDPPTGANYRAGAVTNLFFWSNRYHDILYQYGFTEPARNFQINNFGRGGLGNDFVRAEAQDFAGTFNANFSTPPDGSLPRMQMFL
ncbi:MAG TPA: M36 family metallopeptidase, partial [Pyrinomonadaceae bacterium]|nr:M36 family metallopeptidase [Pyrinomonadaceae bacterium]